MDLKAVLRVLVLLPGLSLATAAMAQSAQQVLDTVVAYGATKVYEIDLDAATDVALDAPVDSSLRACKLTANRGLFCIDAAKNVVNWKNPDSNEPGDILFNCTQVSEFDAKSSETCTAITLDPAGNLWLAGKNKGKTHSLVKIEACLDGPVIGPDGTFCTTLWATGRPLLLDIEYISGEAAGAFTYGDGKVVPQRYLGEGILGLQERKTVVYFPAEDDQGNPVPPQPAAITEISSGKSGWGLVGNEQLQGVTLLQPTTLFDYDNLDSQGAPAETAYDDDHVLVVTSTGRIISMNTATLLPEVIGQQSTCGSRSTQFGIRASAKTGRVYTTSRSCANFTSYTPKVSTIGTVTSLSLEREQDAIDYDAAEEPVVVELTPTPPEGPTLAPGIGVDLNGDDCKSPGGCPITAGATLFIGDSLSSEESGLIVFQVKNIPDCRWINPDACPETGVIVNLDGSAGSFDGSNEVASLQYLNVTPLLPSEITDLFTGDDVLPPLLISPQYRGQDGRFEAFFYLPQDNVRFSGTFEAEYDVAQLAGSFLGCKNPDTPDGSYPSGTLVSDLLLWDVATRVSEDFASVGGPGSDDHVDTMINTGCNSIVTKKPGFSLVPYKFEITPHTLFKIDEADPGTWVVVEDNDAVFARLLKKLYIDLGDTLDDRACVNYEATHDDDPNNNEDNAPLSLEACTVLQSAYADSTPKLERCLDAMYQPKTSAGAQNCQSFWSQFKQFTDVLDYAVPNGPDPANRVGELQGRVAVLKHLYETRVAPSVPVGGFCRELYESTGGEEGCEAPAP